MKKVLLILILFLVNISLIYAQSKYGAIRRKSNNIENNRYNKNRVGNKQQKQKKTQKATSDTHLNTSKVKISEPYIDDIDSIQVEGSYYRIVKSPSIMNKKDAWLKIEDITLSEKDLSIRMSYGDNYANTSNGEWININPNTYIEVQGVRYKIANAKNIAFAPSKTYIISKIQEFTLVFPPIPLNSSYIDFVEPGESDWKIYGIDVADNTPNLEPHHKLKLYKYIGKDSLKAIVANIINKMVFVKGESFNMGATPEQIKDAAADESPSHVVTLSSFYISKTEVTQQEWSAIMGYNPSSFVGACRPVENVSLYDCHTFINKLNEITGMNFKLPTEAQWEYAARGGNLSMGSKFSGGDYPDNIAWNLNNGLQCTHNVGQKDPNELGLYDMSGNVNEWCEDWYGPYSYSTQTNPQGVLAGAYRVYRGGSWQDPSPCCRVSFRNYDTQSKRSSTCGFRLAM